MYKITCDTRAILSEGSIGTIYGNIGNISQGIYEFYSEDELQIIESKLQEYFKDKKEFPVILSVLKIKGEILK